MLKNRYSEAYGRNTFKKISSFSKNSLNLLYFSRFDDIVGHNLGFVTDFICVYNDFFWTLRTLCIRKESIISQLNTIDRQAILNVDFLVNINA